MRILLIVEECRIDTDLESYRLLIEESIKNNTNTSDERGFVSSIVTI